VTTSGTVPATRRRRRIAASLSLVAVVSIVVLLLLVGRGQTRPPVSTAGPVAADLATLTHDGRIAEGDLRHDSRDDMYRTPAGAVTDGTRVIVRLRAAAGDLTSADVLIHDRLHNLNAVAPMHVAATDGTGGQNGYDYWEATIKTQAPTLIDYQFVARDGQAVRYVADDVFADGGSGAAYADAQADRAWQITVYDSAFTTPEWTRGAVVYQIFPDRFRDGDPSNNPRPDVAAGGPSASPYRYGDVYGNPILRKAWTDLPEGSCRAYQGSGCSEAPLGRDFFGGDLAGITASLDELADLGVTVLYLNPIFAAPSNHRYDTSDYLTIDPDLGTAADFTALVAAAKAHGIRLLLDGVFNHVSSDSPWFDRSHRYDAVGACESAGSPYRSWFTFRPPAGSEPSPCAPSTKGGDDTYYVGWFGFDTIPELQETDQVNELINGREGVVAHWLDRGAAGWRLDVMDNLSASFLKRLRATAKAAAPDALILGEQWGDASEWLLGSEADSVMNYRFRRAVIGLINGSTADLDGSIDGLAPSQFVAQMGSVEEDYPGPAFAALLNLVDSHDTTRILWTMTPAEENEAAKSEAAALAEGKTRVREVATLQLTWPGMAGIYYGGEVGLSGQDDPDDRRPYPWGREDIDLRAFYRTLAHLRAEHMALREGDLRFLLADDKSPALAFARTSQAEVALTIMNVATTEQNLTVDVRNVIPDGSVLTDGLGGPGATVHDGSVTLKLPARGQAVLLTPPGVDLIPPAAPGGLSAVPAAGRVGLSWQPVDGAAAYRILRSIVAGGGAQPIGDATATTFADTTVRNGTRYHYWVAAIDAAGNVSPRSEEVTALPELQVADARLDAGATVEQPVSAAGGPAMTVTVTAPGASEAAGAAVGLRLELGFGPAGSDPGGADWTWTAMQFDVDVGGSDRFKGTVSPEAAGTYAVAARYSTSAGDSWVVVDRDGSANGVATGQLTTLTAQPPTDQEGPAAPGAPKVIAVSGTQIALEWTAPDAPDLFRYRVFRVDGAGGARALIGTTTTPTFTDESVQPGGEYVYVVTAQDTSFNESAASSELAVVAEKRQVQVTFSVALPDDTPSSDTIYIAGDFQGWNPGATAMTRVDGSHWTITLPFEDGQHPQYKYTRGTWDAVEKDAGCGEIPNRTVEVDFGGGGAQTIEDVVAKWRDTAHCG